MLHFGSWNFNITQMNINYVIIFTKLMWHAGLYIFIISDIEHMYSTMTLLHGPICIKKDLSSLLRSWQWHLPLHHQCKKLPMEVHDSFVWTLILSEVEGLCTIFCMKHVSVSISAKLKLIPIRVALFWTMHANCHCLPLKMAALHQFYDTYPQPCILTTK